MVASTRAADKVDLLRALGATPVIADGLDRDSLVSAIVAAEPEVVVHQMTALGGVTDFRNWDEAFAVTNRLRTEGTDHLVEGARAAGARRVVAQSFGNWNYERRGGPSKTRGRPARPRSAADDAADARGDPPPRDRRDAQRAFEGIALRYANLYGPHTSFAADGEIVAPGAQAAAADRR